MAEAQPLVVVAEACAIPALHNTTRLHPTVVSAPYVLSLRMHNSFIGVGLTPIPKPDGQVHKQRQGSSNKLPDQLPKARRYCNRALTVPDFF